MGLIRTAGFAICIILIVFSQSVWAESIMTGGSGGMIPLINDLAKAYMTKYPADTIKVMQESVDAIGGIMGVNSGKFDIGLSARLLESDEMSPNLNSIEIARVATVPGVNAQTVKIRSLSKDQICDIYSGSIKNWKDVGGHDSRIRALTRPDADSTKKAVRKGLHCFTSLKEDSGSVIIMQTSRDMIRTLMNAPNSLGFTDGVAVDESGGKVAALNIEGISPSAENIVSGKWPIIKNFVVVTKKQPSASVKRFIDFIKSPEGATIIKKNNAVPVKK